MREYQYISSEWINYFDVLQGKADDMLIYTFRDPEDDKNAYYVPVEKLISQLYGFFRHNNVKIEEIRELVIFLLLEVPTEIKRKYDKIESVFLETTKVLITKALEVNAFNLLDYVKNDLKK